MGQPAVTAAVELGRVARVVLLAEAVWGVLVAAVLVAALIDRRRRP